MDSQGHFTIAAESAAKKLGQSALASESAWVLKCIQAAVATETVEDIRIGLFAGFLEIQFQGEVRWRASRLHELVDNVSGKEERHEVELLFAIRDRLVEDHKFLLVVAGQPEVLYWTGEELRVDVVQELPARSAFSVQTGESHYGMNPAVSLQRLLNLRMTQEIAGHAPFCPIPITLDGRRLDDVSRPEIDNQRFGVLIGRGYHQGELPSLNLPQSWERSLDEGKTDGLPASIKELTNAVSEPVEGAVDSAWLLRAHYTVERTDRRVLWRSAKASSYFLFVRLGVIVDSHPIDIPNLHLSLTVVVDSDRHLHDISGFRLVKNKVLEDRKRTALRNVLSSLPEAWDIVSQPVPRPEYKSLWQELFGFLFAGPREVVQDPKRLEAEIEQEYLKLRSYLGSSV